MNWLRARLQVWLQIPPMDELTVVLDTFSEAYEEINEELDHMLNDLIRIAPREQQNRMKLEWRERLERRL